MDAIKAVGRIKSDLVAYVGSGEASRQRGIIVSPLVWQALKNETDDFRGVIRMTGREGNRSLRYTFYILENPNFPKTEGASSYFFVPHPQEVYTARYLGREDEILLPEKRPEVEIGNRVKITCLNPIMGIVSVDSHYFYSVDFDEIVAASRRAIESGKSIWDELFRFHQENLINNPPETRWIKDEPTYNYHKAEVRNSVGRLLMKRGETGDRWNPYLYQVVGVGIDGYGNIDIVETVMPESEKHDPYEFACFAVHIFLPEEIADFLNQFGVKITPEWLSQIPVKEMWGTWYDHEDIGRLKPVYRTGGKGKDGHLIDAGFIDTRAKEHNIDITEVSDEKDWLNIKTKYFPPKWEGWPRTAQEKFFDKVAKTM